MQDPKEQEFAELLQALIDGGSGLFTEYNTTESYLNDMPFVGFSARHCGGDVYHVIVRRVEKK